MKHAVYFQSSFVFDSRGFKVLLIIHVIWRNSDILTIIIFLFLYAIVHPKKLNVFISSVILLFIII